MAGASPAWWRFLPAGECEGPQLPDLAAAASRGCGELARALRECRARVGALRAASRLRAVELEAGLRFGRPFRLLLVTGQQPRSLEDALSVGFAIVGLAVEVTAVEGVTALRAALDDEGSSAFAGIDLALVALPPRRGDGGDAVGASLDALAARLADRSRCPIAVARFHGSERDLYSAPWSANHPEPPVFASPVSQLPVALGAHPLFDDRFAASFGAMLTPQAADRLADAAAGFAARLTGLAPKLIITDLDGTLWDGVIGESLGAAPAVHAAYAKVLADASRRGILVAIASRNDPGDVEKAFQAAEMPLAHGDIAARAIGWADKASLVADVLAELDLAAEHAVFIDDDPVNCARVAGRFPEMDVRLFSGVPDAFAAALAADPLLAFAEATGSDRDRTRQYGLRAAVEQRRAEAPDMASFLEGLRTTVAVLPLDAANRARAAELAARVNQFRFTAFSPTAPVLADRGSPLDFLLRLDDAFGPHGLVGLVLATPDGDAARIDNLLLSCRALGRGVETAMLGALATIARRRGLARLVGRIEPLPRNEPARDCLLRHGFACEGDEWVHLLPAGRPNCAAFEEAPEGITMNWAGWPAEGRT